jgi:hypothetical protein
MQLPDSTWLGIPFSEILRECCSASSMLFPVLRQAETSNWITHTQSKTREQRLGGRCGVFEDAIKFQQKILVRFEAQPWVTTTSIF